MFPNVNYRYQKKDVSLFAVTVSLIAVIQFIVMTFLAGFFYPGGYSIVKNYFSDLGQVYVQNHLNSISSIMFMFAVFLIVLFLIPYWYLLKKIFSESKLEHVLSNLGLVTGLISSISLVFVALNPVDTRVNTHIFFALLFFLGFGLSIVFYSINFLRYKEFRPLVFSIGLLLLIAYLVYEQSLEKIAIIDPFWEKLVGYLYFVWIFIVDFILWRKFT